MGAFLPFFKIRSRNNLKSQVKFFSAFWSRVYLTILPIFIVLLMAGSPVYGQSTVAISGPSASITSTADVTYTLTYSGATTIVDNTFIETAIDLGFTGDATGTVGVSGTGLTTRLVTISGITGNGTLDITLAGGTSSDGTLDDVGAGPSTTFIVDNAAPTGYSVAIDQAYANSITEGAISFTFSGAEVGATYNYSIDDPGNLGTAPVTGTGTISTATDQITGINVSTLDDAVLTLTVSLTDNPAGNVGGDVTDNVTKETSIPSGYTVVIDQALINSGNETALSFTFAAAEVGTTYNYSIDDAANGATSPIIGSSTIGTATDQITGIDVSTLDDGTLTLTVTLTDDAGNIGADATGNVTKEATPPSGYSVTIDQAFITAANQNALSFTFAGAEVGANYNYSIDDTNGSTPAVNGNGIIATATDQVTGINVSTLDDDVLTLTVYLTDINSNQGGDVTDNVTKDTQAPSGYSVSIDQSFANSINEGALSFTFASAEVGATYNYSIDDSGNLGTVPVTGTGNITTATDQITGIDVSTLDDGTLTLTVSLTDNPVGNVGGDVTDNVTKETSVPSGYAVVIDQASLNSANDNALSFTFAAAEVGTTYNYSIDDAAAPGTAPVTGNGSILTATDQITGIDVTSLNDGTLTLTVTLTDAAGNIGPNATDNVSKDATAPAAPSLPDLNALDDSGFDDTDNYTNVTTNLRISGTAETNSTVELFVGASSQGTTVATGGTWDFMINLSNNVTPYSLTAYATDAAGNTSGVSGTLNITIDGVKPATPGIPNLADGSDSGEKDDDEITKEQNPFFTDAGNQIETGSNRTVKIYSSIDGLVRTGPTEDTDGNYNLATTVVLSEGVHDITVTAVDPAGNESDPSPALEVTVDITPPGIIPSGVRFYAHGSHDHIDIEFDEPLGLPDDFVLDDANDWSSSNGFYTGDSKYLDDYNTPESPSVSKVDLIHLRGNNWTSATTISYNNASGEVIDIAGNLWPSQTNLVTVDPTAPTIVSGMVFSPDSGPANSEQIIFRVSEALSLSEGATVTGFSVDGTLIDLPATGTAIYSSKGESDFITLTSSADGIWTQNSLISYSGGNVTDESTNPLDGFINEPVLLKDVIITSNNASPNDWAKEGDKVFLTFTTTSTFDAAPIVAIDGVTASVSAGSAAPTYIYELLTNGSNTEGDIAISIITDELDDGDSTNVVYTTNASNIVYDRTVPTITPISIASDYVAHPDEASPGNKATLTFTVGDNLSSPTLNPANITIAGQPVTLSGSHPNYTAETTAGLPSTIAEGNLALSIQVVDDAGNSTTATGITTGNNVNFDKTPPTISSISIDPTPLVGIGSTNGVLVSSTLNFIVNFDEEVDGVQASDFTVNTDPNTIAGATIANTGLTLTSGVDGDTQYTLRLDGVTGTGQIRLDYNSNSATIFDLAGQTTSNAPVIGELFTIVDKQPSYQVSALGTQNVNQSQIELKWTEPIAPVDPATHYLIVAHGPSASFPAITDGDNLLIDSDDTDFTDNDIVYISVPVGTSTFAFQEGVSVTGLQAGSRYDFQVYSYNLAPGATTDNVNFNLASAPTTFTTMPTSQQTTITNGSGPATIASINTTNLDWTPVFSFDINDDNNYNLDNLPPYDNVPTKFTDLVINQFNPASGTNTIVDWTEVIAAARLVDDEGNSQEANVAINATNITFSSIQSSNTAQLGWVDDDETKRYTLEIYLKADMSGVQDYPENIDNLNFHFEVNDGSFTFNTTPGNGSGFNGVQTQNSGAGNNAIDVVATELVFDTQPDATVGVNGLFPTTPVLTARDARGNLDHDFNSPVVVTTTNLAIGVVNDPVTFPTTPTTGILTFPANFQLNAAGTTKIDVTSSAPALSVQSNDVIVSYSDDTQIAASGTLTEPAIISSLIDEIGLAQEVFDFEITDDVAPTDDDGIATQMTQIVIAQSADNENEIDDWTKVIGGAILADNFGNSLTILNGEATLTSNTLVFNTDPNVLGNIADDATKIYTLSIWLLPSIDAATADVIDNKNFGFQIDESNITVTALSSTLSNSGTNSGSATNDIQVIATKLDFTTNPDAIANYASNLPTTPVIRARDANNNVDIDYAGPVTITNATGLTMVNEANADLNYNNGVITFNSNFRYTGGGTDADGSDGTLTVSDGVITDAVSTPVTVNYSGTSDIIEVASFSHTDNIDYTSFQENVNIIDDGNSIVMERFKLRDGGGTAPDDDGNPTILNEITLQIANWENLRRIELFDAGANNALATTGVNEQIITGEFITFTGLSLTAPDNGSIDFTVRVSFHGDDYPAPTTDASRDLSPIGDNEAITFTVTSTLEDAFSSQLEFVNAGGATSTLTGDENRIEVTADRAIFTSDVNTSPSTFSTITTPDYWVIKAKDIYYSTDEDFISDAGDITTSGFTPTANLTFQLNGSPIVDLPGSFTAGVYDFQVEAPTLQYTLDGLNGFVHVAVPGITDATTQQHSVFASEESVLEYVAASTQVFIPYKDHVEIQDPTRYSLGEFIIRDGGVDGTDVDGGVTSLSDLTIDITNSANLADIALYDDSGTLIPGTVQASPTGTVSWTGLAIVADDDATKTFTIRAFFNSSVTDNHNIDITVTAVAENGGSKFEFDQGGIVDGTGATTPAGDNLINVVATQLDFDAVLLDPEQGIYIPITPAQPRVYANDEVGNLDLDFSETVLLTTPGAAIGNLPASFSNLSPGILDFPDFEYTSTGDGTITVTTANGLTQTSNTVDVIHTTIRTLDLGPGINQTALNNNIEATTAIRAGGINKALLGFALSAQSGTTSKPELNEITINFNNDITSSLNNIRLVRSPDEPFSDPEELISLEDARGTDFVTFSNIDKLLTETEQFYYVIANIDSVTDDDTPRILPNLVNLSGVADNNIKIDVGSVSTPGDNFVDLVGREYGFDDEIDPTIISTIPANGDETFSKDGIIEITFKEAVKPYEPIIEIYYLETDTLVSTLQATNFDALNPDNAYVTYQFNPSDPLLRLYGPALDADENYFIRIAPGDPVLLKGYRDKSGNPFAGITDNSTLAFKTADEVPPVFISTTAENIIDIGFDLAVALDEKGSVNYTILDITDPVIGNGHPTAAEVRSASFGTSLIDGSIDILLGEEVHYTSIFDETNLTPSSTYRVYFIAEDISGNQMGDADVDSLDVTLAAPPVPGSGPIISTIPGNDPIDVCIGDYQILLAPINIAEAESDDFTVGTNKSIGFILPSEYQFKTDNVTVTGQGTDIDENTVTFSFLSNSILNIKFDITGTSGRDKLVIGGLEIKAIGDEGTVGSITRFGGNAIPGLPEGSILIDLNTTRIPTVTFITDPNTSSISDADVNKKVPLIPNLSALDKGDRVFSGPGVVGQFFYPQTVPYGSQTIVFNYTNERGCTSEFSLVRSVFDSEQAIVGLEQIYNTDSTQTITEILASGRSDYDLVDLKVETAPEQTASIIDQIENPDLYDATDPFGIDVSTSLSKDVNNYVFDPRAFNTEEIYNYFLKADAGENAGGIIGELLFTGVYQNLNNTTIFDTLEQRVTVYYTPIPELTINDNGITIGDTDYDDNNSPAITTDYGPEFEFCEYEDDIELKGSSGIGYFSLRIDHLARTFDTDSIPGLNDNDDGTGSLNIQELVDNLKGRGDSSGVDFKFGEIEVMYTIIRAESGDSVTVSQPIRINPTPIADFIVEAPLCEDIPITFTDATALDPLDASLIETGIGKNATFHPIKSWKWSFDDEVNSGINNESDLANPIHTFKDPKAYNITLEVDDSVACAVSIPLPGISIVVGGRPEVDFKITGTSINEQFEFQSVSTVFTEGFTHSIDSVAWDIDGDNTNYEIGGNDNAPTIDNNITYTFNAGGFTNSGVYDLEFVAVSSVGCTDTLIRKIQVLDNMIASDDQAYSQPFTNGAEDWVAYPEVTLNEATAEWQLAPFNSWAVGNPTTTNITEYPGTSDIAAGSSWVTNLSGTYGDGERSYVYSPTFDLSTLARPMIQFDIARDLEAQDGVVLEYSTDSLNILDPAKEWFPLGETIDEGIEWFNATGLASKPGDEAGNPSALGWDGTSDWVKAKHDLAIIYDFITDQAERDLLMSRVNFRMALGAIAGDKDANGFAFDNVRIGNRTRTVLLENFTSMAGTSVYKAQNDAINSLANGLNETELVVVTYHTSFDGTDALNQLNSSDPGARALYYGISENPRVAIDGVTNPPGENLSGDDTDWGVTYYRKQSLQIAPFDIDITLGEEDGKLKITADMTATTNEITDDFVVHVAIIADTIKVADFDEPIDVNTGETMFYSPLIQLLPNAAGTKFELDGVGLSNGETRQVELLWNPFELLDPTSSDITESNLRVVVFIQDEVGRTVHQADYMEISGLDLVLAVEDQLGIGEVTLYPNPASNRLNIQLSSPLLEEQTAIIFDNTGKRMEELRFNAGQDKLELNTSAYTPGIYLLTMPTNQGSVIKRFIISHN